MVWPGDESYQMANSSNDPDLSDLISGPALFRTVREPMRKRSSSPEFDSNPNRKRFRASNDEEPTRRSYQTPKRYFTETNLVNKDESKSDKNESFVETSEFVKKRDHLIKRLLESRNLIENKPTEDEKTGETLKAPEESNEKTEVPIESTTASAKYLPNRHHLFQDEFIPLFGVQRKEAEPNGDKRDNSPDIEVEEIKVKKQSNFESYQGSYSIHCLRRVRHSLVDSFDDDLRRESNQTNRMFEILKIKMGIKSKFDTDKRVRRMIKRDTEIAKRDLEELIERRNRKLNDIISHHNNHTFYAESDDDILLDDSDEQEGGKNKKPKKIPVKKSKRAQKPNKRDDTSQESGDNEEDVIRMINQEESCINLEEDNESVVSLYDEEEEDDSKCVQFGKYTCSKKTPSKKTNSNKAERTLRMSSNEKNQPDRDRLGGMDDELEFWESKYKLIRNKRNQMLKKKKGEEIQAQRKLMSDELRVIRRKLKKLRKKRNPRFLRDFSPEQAKNPKPMTTKLKPEKPKKRKTKKNFVKSFNNRRMNNKMKTYLTLD